MPAQQLEVHGKRFRLFLPRHEIARCVRHLAERIQADYAGKELTCVVVLKGAFIFAADLLRELSLPCRVEMVRAQSYGMQMHSSGTIHLEPAQLDLRNRHVLVIEDIVDTGLTLQALVAQLHAQHPASLHIVALLAKPPAQTLSVPLTYVGKHIPPVFVIGYGMDYAEAGRTLPDIYAVDEHLS